MAKIQIKSEKLTPLRGIFSSNGAIFPNTDFSDLSDYQMNQMNLYSFPQLDSTLSSVIYLTLGLRCRSFHFMACFLAMAELK